MNWEVKFEFAYIVVFWVFASFYPFEIYSQTISGNITVDTSQIELKHFEKSHLDKYKNDKEFDYEETNIDNSMAAKIKNYIFNLLLQFFKWIFGEKKAFGYLIKFINVFPYIVFGIILFFLLKMILNLKFKDLMRGVSPNTEVKYGIDEEIIRKSDIDKLIEEALQKNDFRLALRYYYLKLLKKLESKDLIKWEPQKTNFEYLKEIKQQDIKTGFKRFTFWYDYIWYGNYPLNIEEFEGMSSEFQMFYNKLNAKNG